MKARYYLSAGFLTGLILKYFALPHQGVFDMDAYYDWGKRTLESNLAKGYGGIYFPLQYQIFELCVWIGRKVNSVPIPIFKSANLVFDVGTFIVLLLLLERQRSKPAYALLYWLHPWFLSMFTLGYVDFQFTFFVLLSVYFLRDDRAIHYLISSIPLGLAFLMKPQTEILIVGAFFHAIFHCLRKRAISPFCIFAGPVLLFLGYEAYFAASGISAMGFTAAFVLPGSYTNLLSVYPSLTAQMLNIWYPIAYFLKKPGDPIYTVSDQILLLPHVPAKWLAGATVLIVLALYAWWVERDAEAALRNKFVRIFAFASLLVPLIMTSAHENHLFLGGVFLILFVATDAPLSFKLAAQVVFAIQFLNVNGIYGKHPLWLAPFLQRIYSEKVAVAYSVISLICFALIFKQLMLRRKPVPESMKMA